MPGKNTVEIEALNEAIKSEKGKPHLTTALFKLKRLSISRTANVSHTAKE